MISDELGQKLHDRATRGEPLTAEEQEQLRRWYEGPVMDKGGELFATEEEVVAGLRELHEQGGLEFNQFVGELEQVLRDRERNGN